MVFQTILPNQQIKQWNTFLACSLNKGAFIKFVIEEWRNVSSHIIEPNAAVFVGFEDKYYCLSREHSREVLELAYKQQEADTRMLFHMKHASTHSFTKFIVHTADPDVFVLCLRHLKNINGSIFIKTEVKDKVRIIDLQKVRDQLDVECDFSADEVLEALIGMHAFSGCDTVSSFAGKGKGKALNLLMKSLKVISMHSNSWVLLWM